MSSISGFYYLTGSLNDGQEEAEVPARSKVVEAKQAPEEFDTREEEESGAEVDEEEGDDVEVPSEPPEDAWFIPLGLARQRPQTFYKGSDPEWQSFVEFSHDKKRNHFIRSL